jgi:ABC-2 type transport system permease protein
MSTVTPTHGERVHPRAAGFFTDWRTVSLRALRLTWRDPEAFGPALVIPLFFFVVNVGALQSFVEGGFPAGFDYKAFQLPVAVVFAVTGVSRANALVTDIQNGYLDRLLLTPVRRGTLLLGLMTADFVHRGPGGAGAAARPGAGHPRRHRLRWHRGVRAAGRVVGPGVHRLPLRDRAAHR